MKCSNCGMRLEDDTAYAHVMKCSVGGATARGPSSTFAEIAQKRQRKDKSRKAPRSPTRSGALATLGPLPRSPSRSKSRSSPLHARSPSPLSSPARQSARSSPQPLLSSSSSSPSLLSSKEVTPSLSNPRSAKRAGRSRITAMKSSSPSYPSQNQRGNSAGGASPNPLVGPPPFSLEFQEYRAREQQRRLTQQQRGQRELGQQQQQQHGSRRLGLDRGGERPTTTDSGLLCRERIGGARARSELRPSGMARTTSSPSLRDPLRRDPLARTMPSKSRARTIPKIRRLGPLQSRGNRLGGGSTANYQRATRARGVGALKVPGNVNQLRNQYFEKLLGKGVPGHLGAGTCDVTYEN